MLKTNIITDAHGNITVQIGGDLDYEYSIPFRNHLATLIDENPHAHINIDLAGVDFVGSSGICHFVETVKLVNKKWNHKLSLSNVRGEFIKVFKLYELNEEEVFIDTFEMNTDQTENLNTIFGNRRRTFQN